MPRNVSPSCQLKEFALPDVANFFRKSEVLIGFSTRMNVERQVCCDARHDRQRELDSIRWKTRVFILVAAATVLLGGTVFGPPDRPPSNSGSLDFSQWAFLALHEDGRPQP